MQLSKHFKLEEFTKSMTATRKGIDNTPGAGEIKNFTGISSDYEAPKNSEIKIDTSINSVNKCLEEIISHLPL